MRKWIAWMILLVLVFPGMALADGGWTISEGTDGKLGIANGEGVFLLPPEYDYINSHGELMCFRGDSVDVYRKSTLEFIGSYPYDPDVNYFSTAAPEVFVIATAEHRVFYSAVTGKELFRVPIQ